MGAFLAEWGLELLLGLVSAIVMGYAKFKGDKLKKELDEAKRLTEEKKKQVQTRPGGLQKLFTR